MDHTVRPKKSPNNVSRQYCRPPQRGNSIEIMLASLNNLLAEECSHLKDAMLADILRREHWLRHMALRLLKALEGINMYMCSRSSMALLVSHHRLCALLQPPASKSQRLLI